MPLLPWAGVLIFSIDLTNMSIDRAGHPARLLYRGQILVETSDAFRSSFYRVEIGE